MTNRSCIIVLACLILSLTTSCSFKNHFSNSYNHVICAAESTKYNSGQKLFLEAWTAIKDQYLDETFNNQDWNKWKHRYIGKIHTLDDAYVAIDTMIESLDDPYTRFLKPKDFKEQNMGINAKLYGIGVNIASLRGKTVIINVIENTPAKKAGLKAGDIITKVNNKPIEGLDISKVADLVRGKAGTTVTLHILRDKTTIVKTVKREKIDLKSVESKMLDSNIAYIKISNFLSQETAFEAAEALEKTKNAKGIILDLRGNHGGLLPNAVLIANMFVDKGIIVSIVDRDGYKETIDASKFDIFTDKPVVVLINETSASASEILSGALKDHHRAKLVGEKTFGKGLVQKIHELPYNTGMNITIAKYLTPNGTDINKKGIEPDYFVKMDEKDLFNDKDPQLDKAKAVIKSEINNYSYARR